MSRYEWERGTFKLSAAEYKRFRDSFAGRINQAKTEDLAIAEKLYADLMALGKGVRGFDYRAKFRELFFKTERRGMWGSEQHVYDFKLTDVYTLERLLFGKPAEPPKYVMEYRAKPLMPKKKDFAPVPATKLRDVSAQGEASVKLNPEEREIVWSVPENNHAIDHARATYVGKLFFELLSRVNWTRATGGTIVGNDEYNRDNREGGGGANYTKAYYGPIGEAQKRDNYYGR